jgi:TM2 domain-containing membrane protein YozV
MFSKIINFQNNPKRSAITACWLSFLFPGAGQIYNRSITKAFVFFSLRIIPLLIIPLFVYLNSVNISHALFFTIFFLFLLPFLSALESFFDAKKNIIHPPNGMLSIIVFVVLSIIFTIIATASIPKHFSLKIITDNYDSPHLMRGDVILIVKNSSQNININNNDLVVIGGVAPNYYRVISSNKSQIQVITDVIIVNGSGLIKELLTESERKRFSSDLHNIVSESNFNERYAVISSNILDFDDIFNMDNNEFFLAKDNRTDSEPFIVVSIEDIFGKVDSVIFSLSLNRIFLKPRL